jgi:predicted esterase
MTSEKMNACKRFVIFISVFFLLQTVAHSQKLAGQTEVPNAGIGPNCNGYLLYLPTGYSGGTERYPLIINIMGIGSQGDGSQASLESLYTTINGGNPHEQAYQGTWKTDTFQVNGQGYKFIVVTPQFIQRLDEHIPAPSEIDAVINRAIQQYRVDTSRIYLIGSSQGGGAVWDYAGSSSQYAKRIAAIVPFGGVSFPFQEKANIMKFGKVAVWAFHSDFDTEVPSSFTKDYVNFYNNAPKPFNISARITLFASTSHLCWFAPLRSEYTENGVDIYHWMLQYQNERSKANAGDDQEITLPTNQTQLTANGTAPNGTAASYLWERFFGPTTGGTISSASSATTNVTNLSQGSYVFRLTITGTDNSTAVDYVAVTVNPLTTRIEDNTYTSIAPVDGSIGGPLPGNFTAETSSVTNTRINNIGKTGWINYSVNVPSAGVYKFRFRAGTFYGGTRFKIQNGTGTQDLSAPVVMYATDWDAYMNFYADVTLQAGTQTIRIQNFPNAGLETKVWFLNWFEIISNTQAIYTSDIPLPVTFILFNTNCSNNNVNITWKTATETNSSEFSVEKSSDGRTWKVIATITAAGQSSTERNYSYIDHGAGTNDFYRIAQQDRDGRKTYTSILRSNCSAEQSFTVFPNPATDKATVTIHSNQNTKLNLSIVDTKGGVVRKQQTMMPQGNNQVTINLSGLAKGIYTLQAEWNNEIKTTKLIKN